MPSTSKSPLLHIPGLNSLRCCAALSVVIDHTEQVKARLALPHLDLSMLGAAGVHLFFVLSGFLITWLLLVERSTTGDVAVPAFYVRRLLRIQPLYLVIVFLGFVLLPHLSLAPHSPVGKAYIPADFGQHYWTSLALYLLMLPNVAFVLFPLPMVVQQAWSIGAEEQFYWLWPAVVRRRTARRLIAICLVYVALVTGARMAVWSVMTFGHAPSWLSVFDALLMRTNMDGLAIGSATAAGMTVLDRSQLDRLYIPALLRFWFPMVLVLLATESSPPYLLWMFLYALIILSMYLQAVRAVDERLVYPRVSEYLGKISYGIYMLHYIAILIAVGIISRWTQWRFDSFFYTHPILSNATLYGLVGAIVIVMAAASYAVLERPFLKLRYRFGATSRL